MKKPFHLRRREPTLWWHCLFGLYQGRKSNYRSVPTLQFRTNHFRSAKIVMWNTRDIAQSKAKDFADSPQTHFSRQMWGWIGDSHQTYFSTQVKLAGGCGAEYKTTGAGGLLAAVHNRRSKTLHRLLTPLVRILRISGLPSQVG